MTETSMKLAGVFRYELDTYDFFDTIVDCNDDTEEWEDFLQGVAEDASEMVDGDVFTKFEDFMDRRDYTNQIADVLYEAAKAFANERIRETGADFNYC